MVLFLALVGCGPAEGKLPDMVGGGDDTAADNGGDGSAETGSDNGGGDCIGHTFAAVSYIPTPGALALLGLGGLVAGRRRR